MEPREPEAGPENTSPHLLDGAVRADVIGPEALAAARMAELLKAMSIDTVISVDDSYALGEDAGTPDEVTEEVVSSPELRGVVVDVLTRIHENLGFARVDQENESAVNDFISENWSSFEHGDRTEMLTAARTRKKDRESNLDEADVVNDLEAPQKLQGVIGSAAKFIRVSLAKWRAESTTLLAGSGQVLVLIDRSFANEPGGDGTTGETLLEQLLVQDLGNVRAGLLTFTAADEDQELALTKDLRARFSAQADKVVAIGKFRLTNVEEFPAAVRMLLLVSEILAYRKLANRALETAHSRVVKDLAGLQDYTLVGAIAAAQQEGTFELDHPLRLAQRVYQQELAREIRDAEFSKTTLPRFREGTVGTFVNASSAGKQINEVLRGDIFEPDDYVNELGLPVEIGDIFVVESLYPDTSTRKKPKPRYFILLAQACDLSMRTNGQRKNDLLEVVLQRVEQVDPDELSTNMGKRERMHLLGQLEGPSPAKWAVNFAQTMVLPTIAVDATVFQSDGAALLMRDAKETRPMAGGWLVRQQELNKRIGKMLDEFAKAEIDMKKVNGKVELLLRLGASYAGTTMDHSKGISAVILVKQRSVKYGIRRVGRVRSDIAVNVAALASNYSSRPAFEARSVAVPNLV